jgi:hypothetical protein
MQNDRRMLVIFSWEMAVGMPHPSSCSDSRLGLTYVCPVRALSRPEAWKAEALGH